MSKRQLYVTLSLMAIICIVWLSPPLTPAMPDATSATDTEKKDSTVDEIGSSGVIASISYSATQATLEVPLYCLPVHDIKVLTGASQIFLERHPELGLTVDDVHLLFETVAELGIFSAQPIIDFDRRSLRITAEGRFTGQKIHDLADIAIKGDAEAALIYGSYLMHQGSLDPQSMTGINIGKLQEGERLLQYAYQNGRTEALDRLFHYFNHASRIAWKKSGPSSDRKAAETSRVAYSVWLLRNTTPGRALMIDNAYRNETVKSPSGQESPTGEHHSPDDVAEKLSQIELQLPPVFNSQVQAGNRERLLWLNRHGLFETFANAWENDCSD